MTLQPYPSGARITDSVIVGGSRPVIFAGPCAVESYEICSEVAQHIKKLSVELDFDYVFKASFDKANRTSAESYRGPSIDEGLRILGEIRKTFQLPIVTDVHESYQCAPTAAVADVLQIPAFLCRQTDLLAAAAKTGKTVKIKKGQFVAPEDMQYAVDKVRKAGNHNVLLTERGSSFGYHNLVVDMRSLPIMRQFAPVIFDVTHSIQRPGGLHGSSGGDRQFAPYLAQAAAAVGVDGFFIETHPHPAKALSDGPNMIPLAEMSSFLKKILSVWRLIYPDTRRQNAS